MRLWTVGRLAREDEENGQWHFQGVFQSLKSAIDAVVDVGDDHYFVVSAPSVVGEMIQDSAVDCLFLWPVQKVATDRFGESADYNWEEVTEDE